MYRPPPRFALGLVVVLLALSGCKDATFGPEIYGTIEGRVLDRDTNVPLANVVVTTSPPSNAILTDSDGRFTVENVAAGNYTITASRSGYSSGTVTVAVQQGRTAQANVLLSASDDDPTPEDSVFTVTVLSWNTIPNTADSSTVRVEYRVRNEGDAVIPNYEVYFRIFTDGPTFFQEQRGTNLGAGQSDIVTFDKPVLGYNATDVVVDDFWYTGQPTSRRRSLRASVAG